MKKLLMICYYYPPIIEVGSFRSVAFSRCLRKYDWTPTVLTILNPYKNYCRVGNTLPHEGIRVIRARSLFNILIPVHFINGLYVRIRRLLGLKISYSLYLWLTNLWLPDFFAPWIPGAIIAGLRMRKESFDAIYVSCSPFSSAIVGSILKKFLQLPLILDFRDPMTNRTHRRKETFFDLCRYKIEEYVLKACDHLVLVAQETMSRYLETYPFLNGKVSVINNGYEDSFRIKEVRESKKNSRFVLNYTGNFYHELIPVEPFFNALRNILDDGSIPDDKIKFQYVGKSGDWLYKVIKNRNLEKVVEVTGHIPHKQVKQYLSNASVMLLRNYRPCITTKVYEGLAMGKVFLATINSKEVEEMISKYSPDSIIVKPSDEVGIADGIKELYKRWGKDQLKDKVSNEFLENYNWHELTGKLAGVLDQTQ